MRDNVLKSYLNLISHVAKSRRFISIAVFDAFGINERRVCSDSIKTLRDD